MRHLSWLSPALVLCGLLLATPAESDEARSFSSVTLRIESSAAELSAWQLRARWNDPRTRIVGVEGGEGAFTEPPRYDPRALRGGEIVLAALAADDSPERGSVRVAVIHVEHAAGTVPGLNILELIAVGSDGERIRARLVQENGEER